MLEDSLLETALGREPTLLESKLLYREKRCGICWRRELDLGETVVARKGWSICGRCQIFGTCCGAHEEISKGEGGHSTELDLNGRTQVSPSLSE